MKNQEKTSEAEHLNEMSSRDLNSPAPASGDASAVNAPDETKSRQSRGIIYVVATLAAYLIRKVLRLPTPGRK